MLASGRPGIGFWVSPKADGAEWIGYDVEAEHSKNLPSDPWDAAHGTGTTSYTGIAEVEPGVVLLACVSCPLRALRALQSCSSVEPLRVAVSTGMTRRAAPGALAMCRRFTACASRSRREHRNWLSCWSQSGHGFVRVSGVWPALVSVNKPCFC